MELTNKITNNISTEVARAEITLAQTVKSKNTSSTSQEKATLETNKSEELQSTAKQVTSEEMKKLVRQSADELNDQLDLKNYSIRFNVDEELNDVVVKIVDTDTDKIIRQIPPEEVVRMRERLAEAGLSGIMVEEQI